MADEGGASAADVSQAFLKHLEDTGFFKQIKELEGNLTSISHELKNFGKAASQRMEETENLAAHILAVEAVLAVVLRKMDIDPEEVRAEVKDRTSAMSGNPDGSAAVHHIANDLIKRPAE